MKRNIQLSDNRVLSYVIPEKLERKLPPDVKERWLNDLRSGEFAQGDCFLKHDGKFCCLGVLVKDALVELESVELERSGNVWAYMNEASFIPTESLEFCWLGPKGTLPVTCYTRTTTAHGHEHVINHDSLVSLNDSRVPFSTIAQVIEDLL
jgi:hypothetical protein